MGNTMWIYGIAIVAVLAVTFSNVKAMEFEDFLTSLSSKKDDESPEIEERSDQNTQELYQFMKRSGLISQPQSKDSIAQSIEENRKILSALQALKRQQNLLVYSPDYAQTSNMATMPQRSTRDIDTKLSYSSYQNPSSKDSSSIKDQQASLAALQSLSQQRSYQPQYSDPSSVLASSQPQISNSNQAASDSARSLSYSTSQQAAGDNGDKATMKDDRQGHYAYDAHSYDTGYGGDALHHARNPVGYEANQYAHEPVGYNKHIKLPIPSVAIKFDPLGLLKLLLQRIPRPLFNLNGRIFLGVELGNKIGLTKGPVHYGGGHSGYGGGNSITIG